MHRRLSLAVALAAAMGPIGAYALGLGDIFTRSALNQRFDADIELISVKPGELADIKVSLAPKEVFEQAGIDRPFLLTQLEFEPRRQPDGRVVVRVTSKDAVREPFLNFLIEVDWPKGRLLREYTVLLDPPVTTGRRPAAVAAPVVQARPARPLPSPTPAGPAPGEYGPVMRDETLWSIAQRLRREGETTQQMLMALFEANPQAFQNDNVNNLMRGQVLRVPSREEVRALSRDEANRAYREQLDAWKGASVPSEEVVSVDEAEQARVELVTVEDDAEPVPAAEEAGAPAEKLRDELLMAQETAEAALQGEEEQRSRVGHLEEQLDDMRRLLELKDQHLATLQASGEPAEKPESDLAGGVEAREPVSGQIPADTGGALAPADEESAEMVVEPEPIEETGVEIVTASTEAQEPEPPVVAEETIVVEETAEPAAPSVTPRARGFFDSPVLLGLVGLVVVVVLAMIGLLVSRRRQQAEAEDTESILSDTAPGATPAFAASAAVGPDSQETDEATQTATATVSQYAGESEIGELQRDTGEVDPVAEADVYLAYGRYQHAEDMLRQALDREPERQELSLKLLEVLHAKQDREGFAEVAGELQASGLPETDRMEWRKIVDMGKSLDPDNPLFGAGWHEEEVADLAELDLSAHAQEAPSSEEVPSSEEEPAPELEDFELDLDLESPSEQQAAEEELPDLDMEGFGQPEPTPAGEPGGMEELPELDIEGLGEPETPEEAPISKESELDLDLDELGLPEAETPQEPELPVAELEGLEEATQAPKPVSGGDEVDTKLDLARAYVDMGDVEDARSILEEVLKEGNESQRQQADSLIQQL